MSGLSTRGAVIVGVVVVVLLVLATWGAVFYGQMREVNEILQECDERFSAGAGRANMEEALEHLGGRNRAVKRLSLYLRLPKWAASKKECAVVLLKECGKQAVPSLARALNDRDRFVRMYAAYGLHKIGPDAEEAVPALEKALKDEHRSVRVIAAEALKSIRGEASESPGEPAP